MKMCGGLMLAAVAVGIGISNFYAPTPQNIILFLVGTIYGALITLSAVLAAFSKRPA